MSADMFNFHEVLSRLQEKEEEVLDYFKEVIDLHPHSLELLNSTREVDYDQEGVSHSHSFLHTLFIVFFLPMVYVIGFLWLSQKA